MAELKRQLFVGLGLSVEPVQPLYGQHTNRICGPIDEVYLNRIRDLEHQLQLAYSEINHLRMLPFLRPLMPRWRAAEELPALRTEVYDLDGEQVTEETSEPVIGLCTNGDIVSVRYVRSECFSGWVETEYAGSRQVAYWMPMPELPEEFRNER